MYKQGSKKGKISALDLLQWKSFVRTLEIRYKQKSLTAIL